MWPTMYEWLFFLGMGGPSWPLLIFVFVIPPNKLFLSLLLLFLEMIAKFILGEWSDYIGPTYNEHAIFHQAC